MTDYREWPAGFYRGDRLTYSQGWIRAMKKRFVIACDGTWNRLDAPHPTNVAKLVQAVLPRDDKGVPQIVLHLDGVGAGRGTGAVAQRIDRVLGGAFGWGLDARIAEAYTILVLNYAPGDEIFIFGYSRGAYTARSLAGMIRNCGILERRHAGMVGRAMELYRLDDPLKKKPDDDASLSFRAKYSAHVTTGQNERAWRRRQPGYTEPQTPPVELGAQYIGVWDTVGALGIPEGLTVSRLLNTRYLFHNTELSRTVKAARHAVAIDERRRTFEPALWVNLHKFAGTGVHLEQWFPGEHGSVGGGGEVTGLSDGALVWVLEGAMEQGLALNAEMLTAWRKGADFRAPLSAVSRRTLAGFFTGVVSKDRAGPGAVAGVSAPARERWRALDYRPKPLTPLAAELDRKPAEAEAA